MTLEILTFVGGFFPFGQAELDFDVAVLPIKFERGNGTALNFHGFAEFEQFGAVDEKAAGAFGLMLLVAGPGLGLDVEAVEKKFALFDAGEGTGHIGQTGAD